MRANGQTYMTKLKVALRNTGKATNDNGNKSGGKCDRNKVAKATTYR